MAYFMHVLLIVSWGHSEIKCKVKQRSNSTLESIYLVKIDTNKWQGNKQRKKERKEYGNNEAKRKIRGRGQRVRHGMK